ncbi:MAG TPA: LLM class flavin-dependent oxidoreductase, partial [Streptosporangiaceae bacterium]
MSRRDGQPGDVPAAARQAEELGFESAWVVDQLVAGTGVPVLDSLTALAGAAAVTSRIRLGVGVLIVPLRPVAWAAKQVATLQYLSGGRVLLGIGAGGDRHAA